MGCVSRLVVGDVACSRAKLLPLVRRLTVRVLVRHLLGSFFDSDGSVHVKAVVLNGDSVDFKPIVDREVVLKLVSMIKEPLLDLLEDAIPLCELGSFRLSVELSSKLHVLVRGVEGFVYLVSFGVKAGFHCLNSRLLLLNKFQSTLHLLMHFLLLGFNVGLVQIEGVLDVRKRVHQKSTLEGWALHGSSQVIKFGISALFGVIHQLLVQLTVEHSWVKLVQVVVQDDVSVSLLQAQLLSEGLTGLSQQGVNKLEVKGLDSFDS